MRVKGSFIRQKPCELLANKDNFDKSGNIDNKTLDNDITVIMQTENLAVE